MSERRNYRRYAIWFPVTIEVAPTQVWGICRDASAGGVLVSSVSAIEIGARVVARFKVTPRGPERALAATVVRELANRDELHLAFPHRIALEFECPADDLLDELERHRDTIQT